MNDKWVRVEPDDPSRCQGVGTNGQCPFQAMKDSAFCPRHGGNRSVEKKRKENRRLYKLAQWQTQYEAAVDHPDIKSLRDEIGIMRMMLQERFTMAKTPQELIMMSGSVSEMVTKIGKLVYSCHRIEKELGQLLDKNQASQLAQEMVTVIGRYIDDADILAFIAEDMLGIIDRLSNTEQTNKDQVESTEQAN